MADSGRALWGDRRVQPFRERWDPDRLRRAVASRPTWIVPFVVACVLLSDRAFVMVASGGQGVLPLLSVLAPLAAIVAVLRHGFDATLALFRYPVFILAVLPFLALTAVMPILGVMFHGYPERTLLSVADATTAASFLVLGAAASSASPREWSRWLILGIGLQLAYAAAQAYNWARGPGWELFTPLAQWDRSLAILEGQLGSVGRSTGLFTNPNELGLWAGVAAVLAWTLLSGRTRAVGVALAVMTLLLSEARGPTVGLLAAVVVGAALGLARGGLLSSKGIRGAMSLALAAVLVTLVMAFQVVDVPVDRFGALVQVLIEGPQADVNLASRLNLWSGVVVLNLSYPWGTWGSPELILGTAVDSAWLRAFAQGSVLYAGALALLIGAALAVRSPAHGDALRLTAVVVAVTGVTQTSLSSPVIPMFWALLGIYLQSALRREPAPYAGQERALGTYRK